MPENPPNIYLDHAATSPLREVAKEAWLEATEILQRYPGNPSSLHSGGRHSRELLEQARERLAAALDCEPGEVVFTSGATESAALGVVGASRSRLGFAGGRQPIVLGSGVDHPAVREQRSVLKGFGVSWVDLPTSAAGVTDVSEDSIRRAVGSQKLLLATLALVCSETGVLQPVGELVKAIRSLSNGLVHTDATQAVGNTSVSFRELGVDLLTLGGHKFGAPVGTGALLVKKSVTPNSDRPGGGQERKLRSGTPDVAGAMALAAAAAEATGDLSTRNSHHRRLRERLRRGLPAGVKFTTEAESVPGIVHLRLPTAHPEAILLEMDRAGICVSAGSACHAGVTRPSPVLLAMGCTEKEALGVLRLSFGPSQSASDIDLFLEALPLALERAQQMDRFETGIRGGAR